MYKKQIRLTESDLKQIVKESVNKILSEAKKKDPMQQWFKDMEDIQKYRNNMEYITKGGRKPKHWNKCSDKRVNEAYNKYNELERFAYENQQVRPMIQKLADFAETVAKISKMQGKDNYYQFYHKLNGDILQMNNLWNFLDDIDD